MYGYGGYEAYGYLAGAGGYNMQSFFTIRDKANTNDAHYASTTQASQYV
jgi:hypothetical protein